MSSFLEKLISGGSAVDNGAPPDLEGIITRRLVKDHALQPPEELGFTLTEDAEVDRVIEGSLAYKANIPVHFMIFEVNDIFIPDSETFWRHCRSNLTLTIKLQSVNGMSEIIAKILRCEETYSLDEARNYLKLDELSRTTPRFRFLSSEHPLFRRYTKRLQEKRDANAIIKQTTEEIKAEKQRALMESLKRAREENAEPPEIRPSPVNRADSRLEPAPSNQMPFIQTFQKTKSIFDNPRSNGVAENVVETSAEPAALESSRTVNDVQGSSDEPVSNKELWELVGLREPVLGKEESVRYCILPSEEYTLSSGEKVICSLKKRFGPPPHPPA